ncbi:hypothetical protein [Desulfohalovibrio reitneri]|uniref:hypothetical protein n=1 Tax=Desulfohalovibrio reitneri TaxID=1307759 RepID=UPI0004A73AC0|nr:hypothetical protein [Desulfohalovibrio reitneri]
MQFVDFTILRPGRDEFRYRVEADTGKVWCTQACEGGSLRPEARCPTCRADSDECQALRMILPVLRFFSTVTSSERVKVAYKDETISAVHETSAQRAAFLVMMHGLVLSRCVLFNRFRFLLNLYKFRLDEHIFFHMLVTYSLLNAMFEGRETNEDEVRHRIAEYTSEIKSRLHRILRGARQLGDKDAALNGLNIIFSVNQLSRDTLGGILKQFRDELTPSPLVYLRGE